MSPLLEHHQRGNSLNGLVPVFNFNIPNDVFHIFKPPTAVPVMPVQGTAPALVAPVAHIPPQLSITETLVSADRVPGPELSLDEFGRMYCLTDGVQNKLDENSYSAKAHDFCVVDHSSSLIPINPCTFIFACFLLALSVLQPCICSCYNMYIILEVPSMKEVAFGILRHNNIHCKLDIVQESISCWE